MRLYIDQMFRIELTDLMRRAGHNVVRAEEVGQSRSDDNEIMHYAISDDRVLVTLDEHFGNWVVLPLKKHPGVIRVKIHPPLTQIIAPRLIAFFQVHKQQDFQDKLVILGMDRERWVGTGL